MANPQHVTLVAATVSTMTFDNFDCIEVVNVDGLGIVYFRTDGTDPTVAGDNCHVIPGVAGAALEVTAPKTGNTTVVKCISAGTPKVSARGSK